MSNDFQHHNIRASAFFCLSRNVLSVLIVVSAKETAGVRRVCRIMGGLVGARDPHTGTVCL